MPNVKVEEDAPPQYSSPQPYPSGEGWPAATPMMDNYGKPGEDAQPQFSNIGAPPPYSSAEGPPVITSQVYAAPAAGWQPGIQNPMYGIPPPVGQVVYVQAPVVDAEEAPDHLCLSIMVFIFCCWPIGIAAMVKASACRTARQNGDRENAIKYGREADVYKRKLN